MPRLEIALEEGFEGDRVVVTVDGDVVFDEPAVRTRHQIGLAASFAVDAPRRCRVAADTRTTGASVEIDTIRTPYVWFSRTPDGLTATAGAEAHRYA